MKNLISAALFLSCLSVGTANAGVVLAPGDDAPDIVMTLTLDGERFDMDWGDARLTLVNFWATFCPPCRDEMPKLQKFYQEHADDGLRVVGILIERPEKKVLEEFLEATGVEYISIFSDKRLLTSWGGIGIVPTTYLIDETGKIRRRYVGATDEAMKQMFTDVERLLAGKPLETMSNSSE